MRKVNEVNVCATGGEGSIPEREKSKCKGPGMGGKGFFGEPDGQAG